MTRISDDTIEEIRSGTDIVDLISEYVQLEKRGKNWFGLCPFHEESSPSFSVSEDKQLFHCFGCGASGNSITFMMDMENRSFIDSIVKLGSRMGMELDAPQSESQSIKSSSTQHMLKAYTLAANFYSHLLLNTIEGEKALEYLEKRGFTRDEIEQYEIGWSPVQSDALSALLARQGFDMKEMETAGLCFHKDDGTGYFDRFRGRIMFPIQDDNGATIAFSGRRLEDSSSDAKYINSPETPIFEKSKILFNFHRARLNVRKTGKVVLFEGFMDTIAADRGGIGNTVAVMGTALSAHHIVKLKRMAKKVVICCDGDTAGWGAAKRFADQLMDSGMDVLVATLPDKMDPDDYISQHGAEVFAEKVLDQPLSYISFVAAFYRKDKNLSVDHDIKQYVHEVFTELAHRCSPIEKDLLIQQLHSETHASKESLAQEFTKSIAKKAKQTRDTGPSEESRPQQSVKAPVNRADTDRAEQLLLAHLLMDADLFEEKRQELQDLFVRDDVIKIFFRLAAFYEQYDLPNYQRFAETLEERQLKKLVMEAILTERSQENAAREVDDCIRHLKRNQLKRLIKEKQHESKEAEKRNDLLKAMELASEIIQLVRSLKVL
ncbi:DNA primase [Sporosarcina sp. P37]|uniref:DNA primase n=1 Tax=unclassified Sporosarcina TaxID=2647733 RepID=UPI0009BDA03F|nr:MULTISPECIES: DNA primase [unclassified Sporosarcina]ARD49565.1 DNA primase [Sporosarcina sp. P33]ARK26105.1 DNA primase [Sporosarcina sp. P37]PID19475.1 DNA primase [Sporosarcina sp. P35]